MFSVSDGARVGLFRVVEQFQGWEDARNHQSSKVTKPPHHRGHQVGHDFSQRVSPAFSLLGTKKTELSSLFYFHNRGGRGWEFEELNKQLSLQLLSRLVIMRQTTAVGAVGHRDLLGKGGAAFFKFKGVASDSLTMLQ